MKPEVTKCDSPKLETLEYRTVDLTPFQSFGYQNLEVSRTLHHRKAEVLKCEIVKSTLWISAWSWPWSPPVVTSKEYGGRS
jgi:hypothetical protein